VGLTTRADIPPSLPAIMLMQTIREASRAQANPQTAANA
jgi:hypothetical protein